jgi:DUF971 family protein
MAASGPELFFPVALSKDEQGRLVIQWNDGQRMVYSWQHLRNSCPCAGCRGERDQPPDPFRLLKPSELLPLAPVSMNPVGRYAYKIVWSDGHDTGIYTLELLRSLGQPEPTSGT